MRENLFRGKRAFTKEWVEGSLLVFMDDAAIVPCETALVHYISPKTVGQYIGQPDKNGKKIFEGDIGRYKQTDGAKRNGKPITCIGKVVYNAKTASFAVESNDETGCKYFDYFPIKDFEVIGNIHDHPELLEANGNGNL